jgi:nucleotide-binding universal stress UspA family protein
MFFSIVLSFATYSTRRKMSIVVAVTDSAEGPHALSVAVAEAKSLGTELVVVNLGLRPLDTSAYGDLTVVNRSGRRDQDQAEVVLGTISERKASRLVIGMKRRTPVGKALIGSLSQQLLLRSPVPVLAVKLDEDDED